MRLPFNYIAKGNAVHEIYAKAGVPFPAGLPSAEQEQDSALKVASMDMLTALGLGEEYPTNPTIYLTNLMFALVSDSNLEAVTATCTVGANTATTESFMCSELTGTGTEYDGKYMLELGELECVPSEAGTYSYTLVVSADGQIYTFNGTFTVEAENQENNEQE